MMSIFLDKLMGPSPDQLTLFLGHWGIVLICISIGLLFGPIIAVCKD